MNILLMILMPLYVALPAFVANMMPVVMARLRLWESLAVPIHSRYFGDHKTWRGFVIGVLSGIVVGVFQWFVWMPYMPTMGSALLFGACAGGGALLGDVIESYIKRRLGIASGKPFIPFDQTDYLCGMLLCTWFLYQWSYQEIVVILAFALVANPVTNIIAYITGIKNTFW